MTAASADLAVLFEGIAQPNVRITRMRSDVAQSALSADMILEATSDQSELTNIHYPAQEIGQPLCPVYNEQCEQTGTAPLGSPGTTPGTYGAGSSGVGGSSSNVMGPGSNGGCSTTKPESSNETALTLVIVLGAAVGFRASRPRRQRRARTGA
jgi:hypothetical protein